MASKSTTSGELPEFIVSAGYGEFIAAALDLAADAIKKQASESGQTLLSDVNVQMAKRGALELRAYHTSTSAA